MRADSRISGPASGFSDQAPSSLACPSLSESVGCPYRCWGNPNEILRIQGPAGRDDCRALHYVDAAGAGLAGGADGCREGELERGEWRKRFERTAYRATIESVEEACTHFGFAECLERLIAKREGQLLLPIHSPTYPPTLFPRLT
jgi:hypothetical protein